MNVDVTEHWPDGRITLRPGVDLATAVPEAPLRATARAMLAQTAAAKVPALGERPQLTLRLTRHAAGFGLRLRLKPGTERKPAPAQRRPVAALMAEIMVERTALTGACTLLDLRQAGISRTQAYRHADAARDLIAAA
jgi:hypothetical protein